METKFGIHLRSAGLSGDTRSGDVHSTNRSVYISKPVEDLKEMFEKGDISSEVSTTHSSKSRGALGFDKTVKPTNAITHSTKVASGTSSVASTKVSESFKFKSSYSSKLGQFGSKERDCNVERSVSPVAVCKSGTPSTDESVPAIAKAKVFGANAQIFTATVENKTNKASNGGLQGLEAIEVDKKAATNQLVTGLALLRIRPGLGKSDDGRKIIHSKSASNSSTDSTDFKMENSVVKETKSLFSTSSHSNEKLEKKFSLDQNRKLNLNQEGLAKVKNVDEVSASQKKVHDATFQPKTFARKDVLRNRVHSPVMRASSSSSSSGGISPRNEMVQVNNTPPKGLHSSSENRRSPTAHGDGNLSKAEAITNRVHSPVMRASSSSSSSGGINPRNEIVQVNNTPPKGLHSRSENRRSPTAHGDGNLNKAEAITEVEKQSQAPERRLAAEILGKEKPVYNRQKSNDSVSSDSERRADSNSNSKFKWVEKGRLSLEEFKEQQKLKSIQKDSTVESAPSQMLLASPDDNDLKRHRSDPFTTGLISPEASSLSRVGSRKLGTINFRNIKEGFEKVAHSVQEDNSKRKPQIEIRTTKNIFERKKSLEVLEVSVRSQTSASLPSLLRSSSLDKGRVLERVKSLNKVDTKAKTPPMIRMQRPSTSSSQNTRQEEQVSSDDYDNIELFKPITMKIPGHVGTVCDDGHSNEGDISSEAGEGLYETITGDKDDSGFHFGKQGIRKRSPGVRRRSKPSQEIEVSQQESSDSVSEVTHEPSGTDGDIDSDSDSSGNSGIYEPIDHIGHRPQCESLEEVEPPPVPVRKQVIKKKKKIEDKACVEKTFKAKIKKLYKGHKNSASTDTDNALLSLTHQALATAVPSSSGVLTLIGGKIKNLKKTKSSNFSKSLDVIPTVTMDLPRQHSESNLMPIELDTSGSSTELEIDLHRQSGYIDADTSMVLPDLESPKLPPTPPPLPPRDHGMFRVHSGDNFTVQKVQSHDGNESPPLPPRNPRVSKNNVNLDMVVPIIHGMKAPTEEQKRKFFPPSKDSYLYGQELHSASEDSELDYLEPSPKQDRVTRKVPSPSSQQHSPKDMVDSYMSVDPPYMDATDLEYSLAHEIQKALQDRKSSAYIKPEDIDSLPNKKNEVFISSPFPHLLQYRSPNDEDDLYIELSDDQVYGRVGNRYKSKLESESLYQFYNKDKIVRASRRKTVYVSSDESDESNSSLYEDMSKFHINARQKSDNDDSATRRDSTVGKDKEPTLKPSTLELLSKKGVSMRVLWAEMEEVKNGGILETITPQERKIQESMFEIISSEATYLKSLNVLINVFLMSPEFSSNMSDRCVITKQQRHIIFSNIGAIRDASERFLADLEATWQKSVLLSDVCDIISKHAIRNFECYVRYCSNQMYQDRAVSALRKEPIFSEALKRLEQNPDCQGLPMISFLLLPMQRITRLPLLVDAICHRLEPRTDRHKSATKALELLNKLVRRCNEGAKRMQQTEQMCLIAKQLDFKVKEIPLISASRFLVKQGEVGRIRNESSSRLPFGKGKPSKQNLFLFLFSDMMLITKKKSNTQYLVIDYAMRNALMVECIDNPEKSRYLPNGVPSGSKNVFLLVLLENFMKKQVEMVLTCANPSDRARWIDAICPSQDADDSEKIYEEWDCPQVQCIEPFMAREPDELTLEESDVVNVFKKMPDGMYEGERIRDGERGWFPSDHAAEIVNSHVRARNLRLRYRMMAVSGSDG
ncbi:hypothetical protein CHS0354_022219 [Potamilus streckersoni]|uniref:Uncharacterized protein n=1 Tax=Potamilus streckersoni TaxID=2493646 RepID=A0AAE0W6Q1_9BIVA|nr:hypothetical protein CHS0354_022219 [Potamilus streckersoni]